MNILDNEFVRKYFMCPPEPLPNGNIGLTNARCMCFADHVLLAMQEPIREGAALPPNRNTYGRYFRGR